MMEINKKRLVILLGIIVVAVLVVYGNSFLSSPLKTMAIRPSEFSEETEDIIELIYDDVMFWDFKVNENVKGYSVSLWKYDQENSNWKSGGMLRGNIECLDNQIAIRINDNEYDIFLSDKDRNKKFSINMSELNIVDVKMHIFEKITEEMEFEINKEIVLYEDICTNRNSMNTNFDEDFREIDCDSGLVIVLKFMDKAVY